MIRRVTLLVFAFVSIFASISASCASEICIRLKNDAVVSSVFPVLSDIADITSSSNRFIDRIKFIEMPEIDPKLRFNFIQARQVRSRLILAGFAPNDFVIVGAESVTVSYRERHPITDAQIEEMALNAVVELSGKDPKSFNVKLLQPLVSSLPENMQSLEQPRIEVRPQRRGLGSVSMQVQIWDGEVLKHTHSAMFDVRQRHRVAVARVSLPRDASLNTQLVSFEERLLDREVDELSPADVIGRQLGATVMAGSVLQMRDIRSTQTGGAPVIRRGDYVTVHVMAGRLRTTMSQVEALKDGALNETISLRNPATKAEFSGRVTGPGIVTLVIR